MRTHTSESMSKPLRRGEGVSLVGSPVSAAVVALLVLVVLVVLAVVAVTAHGSNKPASAQVVAVQAPPTTPARNGQVGGQIGGQVGGGTTSGGGRSPQQSTPRQSPSHQTPTTTGQNELRSAQSSDDGPPWALVLIGGALFGVLIGLGMGMVIGRASGRRAAASAPVAPTAMVPPVHPGPAVAAPSSPRSEHDRQRLVTAVIEVRDQIESPAMREWLRSALADVGVSEVIADGQPFDSRRHQAVDQVATSDPSWNGVVARTDRPGYIDGTISVRLPQVAVYRAGGGA